jgi:hypothetical protein
VLIKAPNWTGHMSIFALLFCVLSSQPSGRFGRVTGATAKIKMLVDIA